MYIFLATKKLTAHFYIKSSTRDETGYWDVTTSYQNYHHYYDNGPYLVMLKTSIEESDLKNDPTGHKKMWSFKTVGR